MSEQAVVVKLSSETYEQLKHSAERSQRSAEEVLSDMAALYFAPLPELDDALSAMQDYSDEDLWRIVAARPPTQDEQRMNALVAKGKQAELNPEEEMVLDALVEQLEQFILIRSEALLQLKLRGYDMDTYLNLSK